MDQVYPGPSCIAFGTMVLCPVCAPFNSQNCSYLDDKLCGDLNQGLTCPLTLHRPSGDAWTHFRTSLSLPAQCLAQVGSLPAMPLSFIPTFPNCTSSIKELHQGKFLLKSICLNTFISFTSLHSSLEILPYIHLFIQTWYCFTWFINHFMGSFISPVR